MKLNRIPVIDLSTGHLTTHTREWMSRMADRGQYGIMERDEGFFMSTHHAECEDGSNLPPDLLLSLSFAAANKVQYVLFDRDASPQAGLPLYREEFLSQEIDGMLLPAQPLDTDHPFVQPEGDEPGLLQWSDTTFQMNRLLFGYTPGSYSLQALRIEKDGEILEDGDYSIPDGAWLSMGSASIRICEPENDKGTLHIAVLPKGFEDTGVEFGALAVSQSDLAEEIENLKLDASPEM